MSNKFNKTFQRILLCGRLAADPTIKILPSGKMVTNFGLVIEDEHGKTDYIPCVAWGERAKRISDNLSKGALMQVEGKLKSSSYKNSEDQKQFSIQFEVSSDTKSLLLFVDNKKSDLTGIEELPDTSGIQ